MTNETENQARLRRAKESVEICQEAENQARAALNRAVEATRRAREKRSELFQAEEKIECARRLKDYNHCTK